MLLSLVLVFFFTQSQPITPSSAIDPLLHPRSTFTWPEYPVRRDPFVPDLPAPPKPKPGAIVVLAPSSRMKVYQIVEYVHGRKVIRYTNIPPRKK